MQRTANPLINLCMPLFKALRQLQGPEAATLPPEFGDAIFQWMLDLDHLSLEKQVPAHFTSDAKYALAALLDESIMRSTWPGKNHWMDQSLQLRLFGEHLAGVNFFNRLARIRQGGELNLPVLEVFFVCLQLGFQGKYAMTQQEELKSVQVDIKHQLDLYKGSFDPSLSFEFEPSQDKGPLSKPRLPAWAWLASGAAILTLLYTVYGFRFSYLHQEHRFAKNTVERVFP